MMGVAFALGMVVAAIIIWWGFFTGKARLTGVAWEKGDFQVEIRLVGFTADQMKSMVDALLAEAHELSRDESSSREKFDDADTGPASRADEAAGSSQRVAQLKTQTDDAAKKLASVSRKKTARVVLR